MVNQQGASSYSVVVVAYRDMVRPLSIRGNCDRNARDAEEHEDQRPPRKVGEATVDSRYYRADKSDDPGELFMTKPLVICRVHPGAAHSILTIPIDMVASAKGSPIMRPRLKPDDLWP